MSGLLSGLGINVDRLAHTIVGPSATTLYTAPGAVGGTARSAVSGVVIANPTPADLKVRLGLIPQGGTSDGTHYLLGDATIPANQSLMLDTKVNLRPGDTLEAYSAPLPPPAAVVASTASAGGTIPAATYYYKLTATNAAGETTASNEAIVTTTGATSQTTITWNRSLGATGYKLYRATTAGSEVLLATISGGATTSYTDTGAVSPAGATPPTAGTAGGCIFTVSGAELS